MSRLVIGPGRLDALVDSEDGVVVTGAEPGMLVRLRATTTAQGQTVTCSGEFVTDPRGTVDTARDSSIGGDYTGLDPFGLLWSVDTEGNLDWSDLRPVDVSVSAESGGRSAEASFSRSWRPAGGAVRDVHEPGVIGRLFSPLGPADGPGVVILSGSGGGLGSVATSALLSAHGMAALALAHWNYPGTTRAMKDIDVEIVGAACDWLRRQAGVRDQRPCVVGISRGGELALLAGSLEPSRVGSVVSLVGSGVAWGAFGPGSSVTDNAWRFRGEPVPMMLEDEDDPDACLEDPDMVAAAEIPVEKAERVLLVSGSSDGMWPSARLSAIAANRATRHGAGKRVTHVEQPDAGHGCTTARVRGARARASPGRRLRMGPRRHPRAKPRGARRHLAPPAAVPRRAASMNAPGTGQRAEFRVGAPCAIHLHADESASGHGAWPRAHPHERGILLLLERGHPGGPLPIRPCTEAWSTRRGALRDRSQVRH